MNPQHLWKSILFHPSLEAKHTSQSRQTSSLHQRITMETAQHVSYLPVHENVYLKLQY